MPLFSLQASSRHMLKALKAHRRFMAFSISTNGPIVNIVIHTSLLAHSFNATPERPNTLHIAAGVVQLSQDSMSSVVTFRHSNPKSLTPALIARDTAVHDPSSDLTTSHNIFEVITTWSLGRS
jgi:hypothetical protein